MVSLYYMGTFLVSVILMFAYLFVWHKHFDIHITLLFVLIPITNLGVALQGTAQTLDVALVATKFVYIGACYVLLVFMFAVFDLCKIQIGRWVRVALFLWTTVIYFSLLTIGEASVFYQSTSLEVIDGSSVLHKQYGPMHTVFIVTVIAFFCASIAAIVYSYLRKNQVSRKNIYLMLLTEVVAMVCFFGGRQTVPGIELIPAAYDFALLVYLIIAYRISLYDINDSAIDSLVQTGGTGFVSFDYKYNYLGSNQTARDVFPQLNELTVDKTIKRSASFAELVVPWIKAFLEDEKDDNVLYEKDQMVYRVTIQHLYSGRRKKGYQLYIVDDTEEQRYIGLLNSFNSDLQAEVQKKTAHIVEMHDNLIMSMAMMVESRDNSTGGHIRRTSEGVRQLVEQMRASGDYELSNSFCRNVIKAAPMHDLGKIAVDDAVLRKPGRFTPEEFKKMQAHSAEGARIVHEILRETDDEEFKRIAENVAHFHHERWDGSGYPEGLAGESIPLEARVMAIADVYDALVSKRVYKEAMSFAKADSIIMEGMGTQFDRGLQNAYVAARPHLESYYSSLESA